MADVSSHLQVFHRQSNAQEQEPLADVQTVDLYGFDFAPPSPPNRSFFMPSRSVLHNFISNSEDTESDCSDSVNDPIFYAEEEQMYSVDSHEDYALDDIDSVSEPFLGPPDNYAYCGNFGSSPTDHLGGELGLGFGIEFDTLAFDSDSTRDKERRTSQSDVDFSTTTGQSSQALKDQELLMITGFSSYASLPCIARACDIPTEN
ncbi:unnamed protein product [Ilex paraguariensis]|uniref:Uncharacterized protein n=1 Tax=Ilex paraguariensis TaxID=185542 RepID=A0ABC8SFJ1_9AQUA